MEMRPFSRATATSATRSLSCCQHAGSPQRMSLSGSAKNDRTETAEKYIKPGPVNIFWGKGTSPDPSAAAAIAFCRNNSHFVHKCVPHLTHT